METVLVFCQLAMLCGCSYLLNGEIRRRSIFVTVQGRGYRLPLDKIMAGEAVVRDGWVFEKYKPEEHDKIRERDANWMD